MLYNFHVINKILIIQNFLETWTHENVADLMLINKFKL